MRVAVLGVDRAGERVDGVDEAGAQVALGGLLGREREVDRVRVDERARLAVATWPSTSRRRRGAGARPGRCRGAGRTTMPALTVSGWPVPRRSFATRARTRSTISSAVPTSASTSASMNSSPPTRPHTSPARSSSRRAAATVRSASSPTAWPSAPLIALKSSRSSATTRDRVAGALGAAQLLGQALLERAVVEQAGERVLERLEQRVGHQVEVAREDADLVAAAQVGAGAAVALADAGWRRRGRGRAGARRCGRAGG